jgi:tetratricopeptide (TPR) repeat protein
MDSRDLPYGESLYLEHQEAMMDVRKFEALFHNYHIDYIILNYQQDDLLAHFQYLKKTGEWVLVYFDDRNVVYVRNTPENKKLIERDGYFFLHPVLTLEQRGIDAQDVPQYIQECKRCIQRNPSLIFPRIILQNIYVAQGELNEAVNMGKEMVRIEPQNARWYILLGETYLQMNDSRQANACFKKATEIDPAAADYIKKKFNHVPND